MTLHYRPPSSIFTFKRAIYRYFLANFARIDVILIIFEKN